MGRHAACSQALATGVAKVGTTPAVILSSKPSQGGTQCDVDLSGQYDGSLHWSTSRCSLAVIVKVTLPIASSSPACVTMPYLQRMWLQPAVFSTIAPHCQHSLYPCRWLHLRKEASAAASSVCRRRRQARFGQTAMRRLTNGPSSIPVRQWGQERMPSCSSCRRWQDRGRQLRGVLAFSASLHPRSQSTAGPAFLET